MATWDEFTKEAPDLARAVRKVMDQGKHKVLATLRRDGSPRVSGTEVEFTFGDLWLGSMPGAMKARDLRRDPRFAVHGPTIDEEMKLGDAKISGRAVEEHDPAVFERFAAHFAEAHGSPPPSGPYHLFRADVGEVVHTWVEDNVMWVESWHEGRGTTKVSRT
jgi:hypothetical protein